MSEVLEANTLVIFMGSIILRKLCQSEKNLTKMNKG